MSSIFRARGSSTIAGLTPGTSADLRSILTDETGTGSAVFANGPTLIAPVIGTVTISGAANVLTIAGTTATTLDITAGSAQSTTPLQQWKATGGGVLASINAAGLAGFGGAAPVTGWAIKGTGHIEASGNVYGAVFQDASNAAGVGAGFLGVGIGSARVYGFSSTSGATGAYDAGLSRIGVGIIGVGTGAAGSVAGSFISAMLGVGMTPVADSGALQAAKTRTITGTVADGLTVAVTLAPTYDAATAQTVTRHNYHKLSNPVLTGAGPAALTDACVFWFNANPGTHKALAAPGGGVLCTIGDGPTGSTAGMPLGWTKINVNGVVRFQPYW